MPKIHELSPTMQLWVSDNYSDISAVPPGSIWVDTEGYELLKKHFNRVEVMHPDHETCKTTVYGCECVGCIDHGFVIKLGPYCQAEVPTTPALSTDTPNALDATTDAGLATGEWTGRYVATRDGLTATPQPPTTP